METQSVPKGIDSSLEVGRREGLEENAHQGMQNEELLQSPPWKTT